MAANGEGSHTFVPQSRLTSLPSKGLVQVCQSCATGPDFSSCSSKPTSPMTDDILGLLDMRFRKQEEKLDAFLQEMRSSLASKPCMKEDQHCVESESVLSFSDEDQGQTEDTCAEIETEQRLRGPRLSVATMVGVEDANHLARANRKSQESGLKSVSTAEVVGGLTSYASSLLNRKEYDPFVNFIVLLNVIQIGAEVDASARLPEDDIPEVFGILNYVFVSIYVVELLIRLCAQGIRGYLCGMDATWNRFDLILVVVAVSEIVGNVAFTSSVANSEQLNLHILRMLRLVRLARLLRGFRFLRLLRYVSSLQTLVHSVIESSRFLIWTCLLLVMIVYMWGIILTQLVSDHCRFEAIELTGKRNAVPVCSHEGLSRYWKSLLHSMLTLFMSVTGGLEWNLAVSGLSDEVGWYATAIFVMFIFFTVFAALNIVTGVFCQSAIESANSDKDIAAMLQVANQTQYADNIRRIFQGMDEDASNQVSLKEFEMALGDPRMSAYLESIGIATQNAWTLFKIMDADEDGSLDLEEFVSGCMQLRGTAKAIHVAKMSVENKITRKAIAKINSDVSQISKRLDAMARHCWAC